MSTRTVYDRVPLNELPSSSDDALSLPATGKTGIELATSPPLYDSQRRGSGDATIVIPAASGIATTTTSGLSAESNSLLPLPPSSSLVASAFAATTSDATIDSAATRDASTAPATTSGGDASALLPRWHRFGAWVALAVAVISMAAIGPTFKYLQEDLQVRPLLAVVWRCQCVLLFLAIPTAIEVYRTPAAERKKWFKPSVHKWNVAWYVLANGIGWSISLSLWVVALGYTTTVRASLFCSAYPLVLVVYYRCRGVHISSGEVIGVLLALTGIIVSLLTSLLAHAGDEGHSQTDLYFGDGLCLLTSFASAMDVVVSYHGRSILPLFVYTFSNQVIVWFFTLIFSLAWEKPDASIDRNGMFGWMASDIVAIVLALGFAVGCIGLLGFNLAIKYVNPLVFAVVGLFDPIITGLMSYIAGLEGLPGLSTWIGGAILCCGVVMVGVSEARRNEQEKAAAAAAAAADEAASPGSGGVAVPQESTTASALSQTPLSYAALPVGPSAAAPSAE